MTTLDIFEFGETFKIWISINLGMEPGKNLNAVRVIMETFPNHLKYNGGADEGIPLGDIFLFWQLKY